MKVIVWSIGRSSMPRFVQLHNDMRIAPFSQKRTPHCSKSAE